MNIDKYFEEVLNKINNLSDEEFYSLLIESGYEDCPYEEYVFADKIEKYFGSLNPTEVINNIELPGVKRSIAELCDWDGVAA